MSPEQADRRPGRGHAHGRLLAGRPAVRTADRHHAFDAQDLRSKAYAEIQRIIREVEPPRPSARLSQNVDTLAGVAAHRHAEPRKLSASSAASWTGSS